MKTEFKRRRKGMGRGTRLWDCLRRLGAVSGFLLLALGLSTGCHQSSSPASGAATGPGSGSSAVPVTTVQVTNVLWPREVDIVGTLYPKDTATLGAQVEGAVESTLVDFGDRVRESQVLATIDSVLYQGLLDQAMANRARAEANLTNASAAFGRVQQLRETRIASDSDYDNVKSLLGQAEAEVKAARAAEGVARLNLERSSVRAPFNGAISQRIVGRGDYVKVGAPLFEMVNDAVLKFIFQVPERYGSEVRKQLPVTFSVDNYPGEVFKGGVYLISPSVTLSSRAFSVGALVTNLDFKLKASTFARGKLFFDAGTPTPAVPLEAVVSFAGITRVFVVENGVARGRTVSLGRVRDGLQEVVSGLVPGQSVVVTGQTKLIDGAAVTLQSAGGRKPSDAAPGAGAGAGASVAGTVPGSTRSDPTNSHGPR